MELEDIHKKYHTEFYVEENPRKLESWRNHAWKAIEKWLDDEEFHSYCTNEMLKKAENPPGSFTTFLYWFGMNCQTGWGVMIDFSERSQQIYLCDHYYKWMHKLREEILEFREKNK